MRVWFVVGVAWVGLVGCSGGGEDSDTDPPAPTSDSPFVQIWSHEDGMYVLEGRPVTLGGSVTDDGPLEDIVTTWLVDGVEQCSGPLDAYDNSTCEWTAPAGMVSAQIRLEAADGGGATGSAEIALLGFVNAPPELRVDEPRTPPWHSNVPVNFVGAARDQGTTPGELTVVWESDLDGPLPEVDGTLDPAGVFRGQALLSQGTHVLTASVTDQSDVTTTVEVTISVGPPN